MVYGGVYECVMDYHAFVFVCEGMAALVHYYLIQNNIYCTKNLNA